MAKIVKREIRYCPCEKPLPTTDGRKLYKNKKYCSSRCGELAFALMNGGIERERAKLLREWHKYQARKKKFLVHWKFYKKAKGGYNGRTV